jgi:glycosyltransferase involved in cell wall biosynthesis
MKLLIVLTYYRPHTSGLTIYAERLAKAMVRRGHQVTVLTSQYEKTLPTEETQDGVKIIRVPVLFRLSKGVIMPKFGWMASKLVAEHDVIQLHLPQFDAAGVALRGRLLKKPTVITYHCDLLMPPGFLSAAANLTIKVVKNLAAQFTHRIVTYTSDYAEHSHYLRRYFGKLDIIPPPVELPEVSHKQIQDFNKQHNPQGFHPVIGMAARFATEKGVEVLLDALPSVIRRFPEVLVQFAGPYQYIVGEEDYYSRLQPRVRNFEESGHWRFLNVLDPQEMACFYPNLDVLVLPSLNSTEAFGLVQIEAMMNNVPCIASDLPGVRQPILLHKMGRVIPIGDAKALANALMEILDQKKKYLVSRDVLQKRYSPDAIAHEYEKLFDRLTEEITSR